MDAIEQNSSAKGLSNICAAASCQSDSAHGSGRGALRGAPRPQRSLPLKLGDYAEGFKAKMMRVRQAALCSTRLPLSAGTEPAKPASVLGDLIEATVS